MTKQKIEFAKYADMHDEEVITGCDGTKVTVRSAIPAADKIELAREYTEQAVMIHDDSCCYKDYNEYLYEIFMIAKYYTDIDTDGASPEEVADFMLNNGILMQVMEIIHDDYEATFAIRDRMADMVMFTYTDDRSIVKAIRTSFGFLFNGEDVTESMAKAEATKNVMVNAFNALIQKEKEDEKNITGGKARMSGNIIDFARRE